jgi:regulator of protease activity HflC (stomatin/prohibitin superfamily)
MNDNEKIRSTVSGYPMVLLGILLVAAAIGCVVLGIRMQKLLLILPIVVFALSGILVLAGLFIVNPNDAMVLVLFGTYKGTVKSNGFCWANPFYLKKKITLRARNLNGQKLKVNDKTGNPIEIAVVVVWQVQDTFRALFDVDNYEGYVVVQSEAAVRHLAGAYPYDTFEDHDVETLTLRAGNDG